jgi:hypothetical protein
MIQDRRLHIDMTEGRELASKIIDLVQNRDESLGAAVAGVAIAYATLCVAEGIGLHDCIELVMTIHKHTKIVEDDEDVDLS